MRACDRSKARNLLIVQRVITPYRYELLEKLSPYFKSINIISSYGERSGAAKPADIDSGGGNVSIIWLRSIRLKIGGDIRKTITYFYPQSILYLLSADIILIEGTTNIVNNFYLVPIARILGKEIVWWDAGYSLDVRTSRRKKIDFFVSKFISMTDKQIAYSAKAKSYMEKFMKANNCELVLNTISTTYFHSINHEIVRSVRLHRLNRDKIKLLYVGAVEERNKRLN